MNGIQRFLLISVIVAAGLAKTASGAINFVILLADDCDWQSFGFMGNPDVQTRHLDKLASEGMVFDHAFTQASVCAPARAAIYSGSYPMTTGAYYNHPRCMIAPPVPNLMQLFTDGGYRVGVAGKIDAGPAKNMPIKMIEPNSRRAIKAFMTADPKQPFVFILGSRDPHGPWDRKPSDAPTVDPLSVSWPSYLVDTPATRSAYAAYLDEVACFDEACGEALAVLEETGFAETTVVLMHSEHGAEFPGGKANCYDDGLRTTMVVRWPGFVEPGSRTHAMIEAIDILPTLLSIANLPVPPNIDGSSFVPVLAGLDNSFRKAVFAANCFGNMRSVRTRKFLYILNIDSRRRYTYTPNRPYSYHAGWWQEWDAAAREDPAVEDRINRYTNRPPVELYEVTPDRNDPFTSTNLVDDPAFKATRERLSQQLEQWSTIQTGSKTIQIHLNAQFLQEELIEQGHVMWMDSLDGGRTFKRQ